MSRILSIWLPAWPIERMRRQDPGCVPVAEPLALIEKGPQGVRLSAVNEAAAAAGIVAGVSLSDARAALPTLAVRQAAPSRDADCLAMLADWLGRYGPARNVDAGDGVWIDITGVPHLFGGENGLCGDLGNRLRRLGLTVRIGLADTYGAAHALARFGSLRAGGSSRAGCDDCWASAPGATRVALASLTVAALRLEPDVVSLLVRLGLKRIGQLYGLPRAALAARFRAARRSAGRRRAETAAAVVLLRLDQALGLVAEPLRPFVAPPEAVSRLAFPDPLLTDQGVTQALQRLADDLVVRLDAHGVGGRRFRLALYRTDGTVAAVVIGTSTPCRDSAHICRLIGERLGNLDAGFGIDVATLEAIGLECLEADQLGLETKGRAGGGAAGSVTIAALVDRLVNRLGPGQVLSCSPGASHIPERAQIWRPALADGRGDRTGSCGASASGWEGAANGKPSRPPLLLAQPEPIDVVAALPEGAPQRFVWRRLARRIVRSEGPERISPEWWRHIGQPGRPPQTRDYYRIEDETGARYWVFREGLYQDEAEGRPSAMAPSDPGGVRGWFVHGLFA